MSSWKIVPVGVVLAAGLVYVAGSVAASDEGPTPHPTIFLPTNEEAARGDSGTPESTDARARDGQRKNGSDDTDDSEGPRGDRADDDRTDDDRDDDRDDDEVEVVRPSPVDVGDDDDDDDGGQGDADD